MRCEKSVQSLRSMSSATSFRPSRGASAVVNPMRQARRRSGCLQSVRARRRHFRGRRLRFARPTPASSTSSSGLGVPARCGVRRGCWEGDDGAQRGRSRGLNVGFDFFRACGGERRRQGSVRSAPVTELTRTSVVCAKGFGGDSKLEGVVEVEFCDGVGVFRRGCG